MKYTLICFTFNKKEDKQGIEMGMTLRNNWVIKVNSFNELCETLDSLGISSNVFHDADKMPTLVNNVIKLSGDFTIADTKIIVHIIRN